MELSYDQYVELMDQLVAEGYDVFEASEMIFSGQLDEMGQQGGGRVTGSNPNVYKPTSTTSGPAGGAMGGRRGGGSSPGRIRPTFQSTGGYGRYAPSSMQRPTPSAAPATRPAAAPTARPAASAPAARPAAAPATRPAASAPSARPAAAPAASAKVDTAPAAKPAGTPMQQWAAANPKLAAAAAERERTRGTSSTTNPLMKDMKSNLPAPSSPSPTTASTGFSLAKKGVDLSKTNKQKINAGMEIQGDRLQEELRGDNYGGNARPDSLLDAYQSIYNS